MISFWLRSCGVVTLFGLLLWASRAQADDGGLSRRLGQARLVDGRGLPQGSVVIDSASELSYANNLFADGADDVFFASRLSLSASLLDELALGLSFGTLANRHDSRRPPVSQTVGDPSLLLRAGTTLSPWLSVGGLLDLRVPTSGDGFGLAWQAISPRAILSAGVHLSLGLSAYVNAGLDYNRSEQAFAQSLDPILRYSAQAADTPALTLAAGLDYRWAVIDALSVSPYLEAQALLPVISVDTELGSSGNLGLGLRVGVGTDDDLSIRAGLALAWLRPDVFQAAVPAVAPWTVDVGISYRFDPLGLQQKAPAPPPPPVVKTPPPPPKEIIREVAPATGFIQGRVIDARTRAPLVNAIVEVDGSEASPLSVNGADGSFKTFALLANRPYKLRAKANGYTVGEINAMVGADAVRTIEIPLTPSNAVQFGEIRGVIKGDKGVPLQASVAVAGVKRGRIKTDASTGAFSLKVPVGDHVVAVGARGYRTQKKKIRIRPGDVVILNVDLAR